ncbi:transposase (plasmid) [Clostridium botulinum A2B7 92]|uniref:RNA-guided endonuclease InsQ/TnpB family protein n=1 Tax=Clostridium botulinum TaxID=1491 RepID=UPI0007E07CEC|nr:RNA-guided endonuclease TnpB family protein [Clostridium botulinum]KEI94126.1 transposase [Clostridium botulinum A2B7 92]
MKLAFKFDPQLNSLQSSIIEELSYHTTRLYNIANYDNLQRCVKSYLQMNTMYNTNWHKDFLHSHNYQHCLRVLEKNWKSYFKAIIDYKKNPSKYLGYPRPPKYKNHNDRKNEAIFTKAGIRFKYNTLMLSLSKAMKVKYGVKSLNFEVSDKLQSLLNWNSLNQVKIKWDNSIKKWYLILIYEKEETLIPEDFSNIMAIDLGLNNLATITFLANEDSYIINGKPLKSVNSFVNKKIAYLQSIAMSMTGSAKHKDTKGITKLRRYRENYINNYLHKSSKQVIELALNYKVKTIVIGDIKGIKLNMNYAKTFVQVPIQRFKELIEYKARLLGIEVKYQKEAYSSGCSALDLESINKVSYNKNRRIYRGLFKSNTDIKINADVNGSLNILRLYVKDKCIPKLIKIVKDMGYVNSPVKQRIA